MMTKEERKLLETLVEKVTELGTKVDDLHDAMDTILATVRDDANPLEEVANDVLAAAVKNLDPVPMTWGQLVEAVEGQGVPLANQNAKGRLRLVLGDSDWSSPRDVTRLDGKVGRWWFPPLKRAV